ncbi:MAG: hypothetical protein ACJ79L_11620, partial [Anaeromyxobacteraceae bacterium]
MTEGLAAAAVVALLAAASLAAVALLLRFRRRRPGPRRAPPRLRHPVVLAHGLLGFDAVELGGVRHAYFRGVPALLAAR